MSASRAIKHADACTALAFDYGNRRIGVAVGAALAASAEPLASVAVDNGRVDFVAIGALVDTWQPDVFVLGRPRHADGTAATLDAAIVRFARRLEGRFRRPVHFVDEYLSSWEAQSRGGARAAGGLDAAAAAVILETWFAARADAG
ncbi:MAG: Holliday junction resolvase RuvX [Gammaproteobacteria bacterium]